MTETWPEFEPTPMETPAAELPTAKKKKKWRVVKKQRKTVRKAPSPPRTPSRKRSVAKRRGRLLRAVSEPARPKRGAKRIGRPKGSKNKPKTMPKRLQIITAGQSNMIVESPPAMKTLRQLSVIEFIEMLGIVVLPWQRTAIETALEKKS